jgi:hypothetical protein
MTNVMYKFLNNLFTFALHVSGFVLGHLDRQVYNFGSGSSLLGMVSVPQVCWVWFQRPKSAGYGVSALSADTIPSRLEPLPKLYTCL